jgi:hypothetical protein
MRQLGFTVVSNHFHSVKNFLFSAAKSHDFDGMLGTGLPAGVRYLTVYLITEIYQDR